MNRPDGISLEQVKRKTKAESFITAICGNAYIGLRCTLFVQKTWRSKRHRRGAQISPTHSRLYEKPACRRGGPVENFVQCGDAATDIAVLRK
jgi:hypothetical protein